jgi:hypothetical protein
MKENESPVRIYDVIPVNDISGQVPKEFDRLPMYEVIDEETLKENYGLKRNHDDILVYDVSTASEELRSKYASSIVEMHIRNVIKITKDKKQNVGRVGQIVTVLPLDGVYTTLSREEMDAIGHDYVTLTNTEDGIKVDPLISSKNLPDNMYLSIDARKNMSEDLEVKIAPEIVELSKKENGLYEDRGGISTKKEL